jgi:hypothetical protein
MRKGEQPLGESQLVHDFQRRGMHGVAAEIAQKIGVLLAHDNVNAGTGEEITEHHTGRAAARDCALGPKLLHDPSRDSDVPIYLGR